MALKKINIFIFNSSLLILSTLLLKGLTSVFDIYIATKIGSQALGTYTLLLSIYTFLITIASSGITLACTKLTSESLALNLKTEAKKYADNCIFISLFFGLISSILLLIFHNYITLFFLHNKIDDIPLIAIALGLPFISMTSAISGYFVATRHIYKNVISQVLEQSSKILFIYFLLNFSTSNDLSYTCFALILGDVLSEIIAFCTSFVLYKKEQKVLFRESKTKTNHISNILKIALPVSLTSFIKSGLSTLKQIIIPSKLVISGLTYNTAISKYGIISGMVMPLLLFPGIIMISFGGLLIPEISEYAAKKDYKKIEKITSYSLVITSIISILIAVLVMIFANGLNKAFYPNYTISKYLIFLAPIVVFIYIDIVVDSILKGLNAQVSVMFINIFDLVFTVSFIYFFVPILGTKGYIFSLYISEFLNFILSSLRLFSLNLNSSK